MSDDGATGERGRREADPDDTVPPRDGDADATVDPRPRDDHDAIDAPDRRIGVDAGSLVGRSIAGYAIVRMIGRGGMGIVYEAEQRQPRRIVALKVINAGVTSPAALRRFEHESQVLGRLQHPNIAAIYEAGSFDLGDGPQPYFAMEFVRGRMLGEHANGRGLGTRERLRLISRICNAVQHAHQKGVIHRDLKPANILVTDEGEPKILDFGVARTTDTDVQAVTLRTDIGQLVGTVPYMSPEQAGANPDELDTRSDVYALGVVAYELLAGRLPYDLSRRMIHEAVRVIREEEPTRLSAIDMSLRGDVEIVVGKALQKEREHRYQSAADFAADIDRYLADRPIVARPPSAVYQFRKFTRRNRALVGGATTALVALVGGLVGTSYGLAQAVEARNAEAAQTELAQERERDAIRAREEAISARQAERQRADELEQVAAFQAHQLGTIEPERMGDDIRTRIAAMRRASLERGGHDDDMITAVLAELERSLDGVNFTGVALEALDRHIFERSLEAIDAQFGDQPLVRARLLETVALALQDLGLPDRTTSLQEEVLRLRRLELGAEHPDTIASLAALGFLLYHHGHPAEAEPHLRTAIDLSERVLGPDEPLTLTATNNLAAVLRALGRAGEAEPLYRRTVESRRRALGDDDIQTLNSINNFANFLAGAGRFVEAEPHFRAALDGYRRTLGPDDPATLVATSNMGNVLRALGRLHEAEPFQREAVAILSRVRGDDHPSTISALSNLGGLLRERGATREAEAILRRALDAARPVLGESHPSTLTVMGNLAVALESQDHLAEAVELRRERHLIVQRERGATHRTTLLTLIDLGRLLETLGERDEIVMRFGSAETTARATLGAASPPELAAFLAILGRAHAGGAFDAGVFLKAESTLLEAQRMFAAALGDDHDDSDRCVRGLVDLYTVWAAAEPDGSHGEKAEQWRGRLRAEG